MLVRVLEAEAMDAPGDAREYDRIDHSTVNDRFVTDFLAIHGPCRGGEILDVGTGPARIPIRLCFGQPAARVLGIDLARTMVELARANVADAGLSGRIRIDAADGKNLPYHNGAFEAVLCNTIIHHLADPGPALREMARLVAPEGTLMIRDLCRPSDETALACLVDRYMADASPEGRALYEASLHAALTLEEMQALVAAQGLPSDGVTMTSDRHWTWVWRRHS